MTLIVYQSLILEVLRNRSKQLRKAVYLSDENKKGSMPTKNTEDDLAEKLAYCKTFEQHIETDLSLSSSVAIKEKLNLLKEPLEDTPEHYLLSKDTDTRVGHKSIVSFIVIWLVDYLLIEFVITSVAK